MKKLFLAALISCLVAAAPASARCQTAQLKDKARTQNGSWLAVYESSSGERVQLVVAFPARFIRYDFRNYQLCD